MTMDRFVREINDLSATLTQNMADYTLASSRVEMSVIGGILNFQPEGNADVVQIRLQSEVARKAFTQVLAMDSNAAVSRILHTLRELQCITNDAVDHVVNAMSSIDATAASTEGDVTIDMPPAQSRLIPVQVDVQSTPPIRRVRNITSPVMK